MLLVSSDSKTPIDPDYMKMSTPKAGRVWITGMYRTKKGDKVELFPKEKLTAKHVANDHDAALITHSLRAFCPPTSKSIHFDGKEVGAWYASWVAR